jgi:hypothetical protein
LRHEISIHPTALHYHACHLARATPATANLEHPRNAGIAAGTSAATDTAIGSAAIAALANPISDTDQEFLLWSVYRSGSAATYRDQDSDQ